MKYVVANLCKVLCEAAVKIFIHTVDGAELPLSTSVLGTVINVLCD